MSPFAFRAYSLGRDTAPRVGRNQWGKWRTKPACTPLVQPVHFRQNGHEWPRHHNYASEREHTLWVGIYTQRYKRRRSQLDPTKIKVLDAAAPGWQTGRTRGRPLRRWLEGRRLTRRGDYDDTPASRFRRALQSPSLESWEPLTWSPGLPRRLSP